MKIEMGESLFYSWLRHVKSCHVVQTNWKASSQWELHNAEKLEMLMETVSKYFNKKYDYDVFKGNKHSSQLLRQGECDVLGMQLTPQGNKIYAIDVAFHEGGLNYGDKATTIMKVIEKCVRTAFCLYGYMDVKDSEIIFASPKINPAILKELEPYFSELNDLFTDNGFDFIFCLLANEDFNGQVLQPILRASKNIADTAELFLRSYQLFTLFNRNFIQHDSGTTVATIEDEYLDSDAYCELKVGQLAQRVLGKMLRDGCVSDSEIISMQSSDYSKKIFDLQYPLLVKADHHFEKERYYAKPISIKEDLYYMCSQWYETPANNDRPYLLKWIGKHQKSNTEK